MKLLTVALILMSQLAFANQTQSLEQRHVELITRSVVDSCGKFRNLKIASISKNKVKIDQGIVDYEYLVMLTGEQRMDQNIFDKYVITVESYYYDGYDHATKELGSYSIKDIKCVML